jgi:signal transduction histidine kinase
MVTTVEGSLAEDVAAVARIGAVPMILDVVCRTTGMGFSAVARVTEQHWVACAVRDEIAFGLQPGGELKVETTICNEIRANGELVAIDHVAEHETFCRHPTPAMYGFQSYISVPILRPDGRFFGTLCAIDPKPARLNNPATIGMFKLFADLIAFHLDAQDRLAASESALRDELQTAELREQFIAILGHDLRNPLAAIDASAAVLMALPLDQKALQVAARIKRSAGRMAGLIANLVDFARGRLGGGLPLTRTLATDLAGVLEQVVAELQSTSPDRTIITNFSLGHPVYCDSARPAQLLSNLLANALSHGAPDQPVRVEAHSDQEVFELSVANSGQPLPEATLAHLFQPFVRAGDRSNQGLGLGLYIASEIARAHQGELDVTSSGDQTRFTLRIRQRRG